MLKILTFTEDHFGSRLACESRTIEFGRGINALIGSNGSGKSTIFDMIMQGSCGERTECFEIETYSEDGPFDVRGLRMQDLGKQMTNEYANSDQYREGLMAHFESHGQNNWASLHDVSCFEEGTLLLFDEPEQALDFDHLQDFIGQLHKQRERLQIVIATHHPLLIAAADHHIVVDKDSNYANRIMDEYRALLG